MLPVVDRGHAHPETSRRLRVASAFDDHHPDLESVQTHGFSIHFFALQHARVWLAESQPSRQRDEYHHGGTIDVEPATISIGC